MENTKVLITVKTYPALSSKYDELVCTAGIRESDGKWIRIYPVPFRKLNYEQQYRKYHWMELPLVKNTEDFRPESYKPASINKITLLDEIKPDGNAWNDRRKWVLKKVYTNLTDLIAEAKDRQVMTSLATFKPKRILDFKIEKVESEWSKDKLDKIKAQAAQLNLFDEASHLFEVVKKLPYKFSYEFEDDAGRRSTLMIEDWEIGALYWNGIKAGKSEKQACEAVKQKYQLEFANKDVFLFLGTSKDFHLIGPNPFMIIGVFYPKHQSQLPLFS